jgi:hypothetical protein
MGRADDPNIVASETLFRWEDDQGRVAYGPGQSVWNHVSQKAMRAKAAGRRRVAPWGAVALRP